MLLQDASNNAETASHFNIGLGRPDVSQIWMILCLKTKSIVNPL